MSSFADGVTRAGVDTKLYTPFDFPYILCPAHVFIKGAPMSELAEVLAEDSLYPHPERLVPFLGNHDTERLLLRPGSEAAMRLAFAYVLTTRGMAQIYSGDEIAMPGGGDPENRHEFPGGFPGGASAFVMSGRTPVQQETFDWVAKLTMVRRKHDALGCGAEQVLASNDDWMVTLRDAGKADGCGASGERVLVAIHRGGKNGAVAARDAGCAAGDDVDAGLPAGGGGDSIGWSDGGNRGRIIAPEGDGGCGVGGKLRVGPGERGRSRLRVASLREVAR